MGFNHATHVLQPLLEKAQSEASAYNRPTKKTLLELAETLVNCSFRPSVVIPYYSDEEREAAKQLLKVNGLGRLANCSPRYRERTLALIENEKAILADFESEQLSQSQQNGESKLEKMTQLEENAETSQPINQNLLAKLPDMEAV